MESYLQNLWIFVQISDRLWYNIIESKEVLNMAKHFIIGDVHGMAEELEALLTKLAPTPEDAVIFVGDLVDKGPNSVGAVQAARQLSQTVPVVVVEGNHEDKHRRFRRNLTLRPEVAEGQASRQPELVEITNELEDADVSFLDSAVPFHRIDEHNILIVHAGIPGDMVEFPATVEEASAMTGKKKRMLEKTARVRHISAETGKFLKLGDATEADPFWAEVHDGRFGHVVFGHEPFVNGVAHFTHATGVDTGAVFGGSLTAMVVESDGTRSFVSVPARKMANMRGEI
jgi:diadenosine tetraphosphatase ApaH/serine/threonine PP2A family protein phosphatase